MATNTVNGRPQVVIAENDAILRYTVKLIVQEHYDVVGEATDGRKAVQFAEELRPDVVLLDISMPVMTGLQAARLIRERLPDVRVIIVSNHASTAYIDEAFTIGVHGYVIKGSAALQLPTAIKEALDGRIFRPA